MSSLRNTVQPSIPQNSNAMNTARCKKIINRGLEILFWIVAALFMPIVNIVLWILRMRNLKVESPDRGRGYMWVIFAFVVLGNILSFCMALLVMVALAGFAQPSASISRENVRATEYGTAEELYRLTGVRFSDIVAVDSLQYNMYGVDPMEWIEHKYVFADGPDESFYELLEEACVSGPGSWEVSGDAVTPYFYLDVRAGLKDKAYRYNWYEYDYSESPRRGNFIWVEVQQDTVWVREGYQSF